MFWACFSGITKGPHLFWEKEWGSINKESYCQHVIPLVHGWCRLNPSLTFMQDNASGHAAKMTIQELKERGVVSMEWPAFSPDLNPIETLWNIMKDWLATHYPSRNASYDQLRDHVNEAWEAIGAETLRDLIATMPQRCQDVIDADGGPTKW